MLPRICAICRAPGSSEVTEPAKTSTAVVGAETAKPAGQIWARSRCSERLRHIGVSLETKPFGSDFVCENAGQAGLFLKCVIYLTCEEAGVGRSRARLIGAERVPVKPSRVAKIVQTLASAKTLADELV